MIWTYLVIASLFEIAFALGLKYTDGFSRFMPSMLSVVAGNASFLILSQGLRTLPVSTGYAMWTGIGAVGTPALPRADHQRHHRSSVHGNAGGLTAALQHGRHARRTA